MFSENGVYTPKTENRPCKDNRVRKPKTLQEPALAKNGEIGRGRNSCNNITANSRGTDPTYTLKRLKRDHPELANAVINGELSANAAAIQAGFRKPSITINPDPESAATAIRRKFGDEFAHQLAEALTHEI